MIERIKATVKIWRSTEKHGSGEPYNKDRLKMIGYCFEEEKVGCVYDLSADDSLHNISPKGTREASTVLIQENEGEICQENKRMKCEENDDLISALPDCLIQHILSFLPTTMDAIRTGILSKRWLCQWTHVPNLIFKCNDGMSIENFSDFVDNVLNLYSCSKIAKFAINSNNFSLGELHRELTRLILYFASTRDVKELILECGDDDLYENHEDNEDHEYYSLPQFLFNYDFLVKLKMRCCLFMVKEGEVNWASLKALQIEFVHLPKRCIENVLSGSPVIEYLELRSCYGFEELVVASKSLKTFRMIQSIDYTGAIEISCPNLKKLDMSSEIWFECKFKDLSSSVCATLNFKSDRYWLYTSEKLKLVKEVLLQVQHVKELSLGPWFLMFLLHAAMRGESTLLLNSRCLTLIDPFSKVRQPRFPVSHLRFSLLEKLVIKLLHSVDNFDLNLMGRSMEIEKKFLKLDVTVFDTLVSNLKTVEIVGLLYIYT